MVKAIATSYPAWPEDPIYIDITESDGSKDRWPTNTTEYVENDGTVNWMKPVGLEEAPTRKWRHHIGQALANHIGVKDETQRARYVLRDWPANYAFFVHLKGPRTSPRHDVYLFGSSKVAKFRSSPEFLYHSLWLYDGKQGTCPCKYCSGKKSQQEVTQVLSSQGYYQKRTTPSPSPGVPAMRKTKGVALKTKRPKDTRMYAAVQRQPVTVARSYHISDDFMSFERRLDVQAMTSHHTRQFKRWFRDDEAVWIKLRWPIEGPDNTSITLWPGVIKDIIYRGAPVPSKDGDDSKPWQIQQRWFYKVQLFALGSLNSEYISQERVLPWLAYTPDSQKLYEHPGTRLTEDDLTKESLENFNPLSDPPPSYDDTVPRYMLACNISNEVALSFCLSHHFDFDFQIATISPQKQQSQNSASAPLQTSSLADALNASSQQNAQALEQLDARPSTSSQMGPPGPAFAYRNVIGPSEIVPSDSPQPSAKEIIGTIPSVSRPVKQKRFEGLWWGAERIWVDDFVRLKLPRRRLAPEGARNILPPSGPGPSFLNSLKGHPNLNADDGGAWSRGIFMQMTGIFVVDVTSQDGLPVKESRASGLLYELADEDWQENDVRALPSGNSLTSVPASVPAKKHGSVGPPPVNDPFAVTRPNPVGQTKAALPHSGQSFHLPLAPHGFKFRPILAEGYEAVISFSLLAGRYYPRILTHPLLHPVVSEDEVINDRNEYLWALEGFSVNYNEEFEPTKCKASRVKILNSADAVGKAAFREELKKDLQAKEEDMDVKMDVD